MKEAQIESGREEVLDERAETGTYELGYLIIPTLSEEELSQAVADVRSAVERSEGRLFSEGFPSERQLAYDVSRSVRGSRKKFSRAYFGWMRFEASREAIEIVKSALYENERVLRFLILSADLSDIGPARGRSVIKKPYVRRIRKSMAPTAEISKKKAPAISEEELEKTIEELVIE